MEKGDPWVAFSFGPYAAASKPKSCRSRLLQADAMAKLLALVSGQSLNTAGKALMDHNIAALAGALR